MCIKSLVTQEVSEAPERELQGRPFWDRSFFFVKSLLRPRSLVGITGIVTLRGAQEQTMLSPRASTHPRRPQSLLLPLLVLLPVSKVLPSPLCACWGRLLLRDAVLVPVLHGKLYASQGSHLTWMMDGTARYNFKRKPDTQDCDDISWKSCF